jgi:hypothetical protein
MNTLADKEIALSIGDRFRSLGGKTKHPTPITQVEGLTIADAAAELGEGKAPLEWFTSSRGAWSHFPFESRPRPE